MAAGGGDLAAFRIAWRRVAARLRASAAVVARALSRAKRDRCSCAHLLVRVRALTRGADAHTGVWRRKSKNITCVADTISYAWRDMAFCAAAWRT